MVEHSLTPESEWVTSKALHLPGPKSPLLEGPMGHATYQWPNSWKMSCVAVRLELSKGGDVGFLMKLTVSLMCGVPTS